MTANPIPDQPAAIHYKEPDWFTRNVLNRLLNGLTRLGVSVMGSRVLEHRGRTSGKVFHTPVNLLTIEGTEYLVSPRGETQWVRNVRHAGGHLVLILGRRRRRARRPRSPWPTRAHPARLPAPLEVRGRDVLRRRVTGLHRRGMGGGRRRGTRSSCSVEPRAARGRPFRQVPLRHGIMVAHDRSPVPGRARAPQPHRVQPCRHPLGEPGGARGRGRRGPVRRRHLDPRRGQRRLPHRPRSGRWRAHRPRRRVLRQPGPRVHHQGPRHRRGRRPPPGVRSRRPGAFRHSGAPDDCRQPAP